MKNSINYYTREERNGVTLLLTFVMLFTVFVFIQNANVKTSVTLNVHIESVLNDTEEIKEIAFASSQESSQKPFQDYKREYEKVEQKSAKSKSTKEVLASLVTQLDTSTFEKQKTFKEKKEVSRKKTKFIPYKRKESQRISLSSSNEEDWQKLRGIGKVFSKRIVKYKKWLGGFNTVEQLKEVYGMTDSLYQTIEPFIIPEVKMDYININTCDIKQLGKHPYVNWKDAKKIIAYRKQHGPYKNVSDLDKIIGLDREKIEKFKPYISFKENVRMIESSEQAFAQNEK